MTTDHSLKTFWRILYVLYHSELHISISNNIRVSLVFLITLNSALLMLEARLIKVYFLGHNNGLNRNQNLQKGRYFGIPILHSTSSPSTQQTETHFTTGIQVRVKSNSSRTSCCQINLWWVIRIAIVKVYIE